MKFFRSSYKLKFTVMYGEQKRIPGIMPAATSKTFVNDNRTPSNINCNFDQMIKLMTRAACKKTKKEQMTPMMLKLM